MKIKSRLFQEQNMTRNEASEHKAPLVMGAGG